MKKLRVTIEGKTYDVLVEVLDEPGTPVAAPLAPAAAPVIVAAPPAAPVAPAAPALVSSNAAAGDVPCPLTGKVVSIEVKLGDSVAEGAQLATVEAMKMNTYI